MARVSLRSLSRGGSRNQRPFLRDSTEYARFKAEYHQFPRSMRQQTRSGTQVLSGEVPLLQAARRSLAELASHTDGKGFRGLAVRVHQGDGMSWSATAAYDGVRSANSKVRMHPLIGKMSLSDLGDAKTADSLPAIEELVSRRRVAKLAQKHKVTTAFPTMRRGAMVGLGLAAVALGVMSTLLTAVVKGSTPKAPGFDLLLQLPFLLPAAALPLLTIALNDVSARLKRDPKAFSQLAADVATAARERSVQHTQFAEELASALAAFRLPRCIVIDKFDELDLTTRTVIDLYFQRAERAGHYELWVIFERFDLKTFRSVASRQPGEIDPRVETGYRLTRLYDQTLLSLDDRRRLADHSGVPERADFAEVAVIRHPDREHDDKVTAELDRYRRQRTLDAPADLPLRLFHLLALNAVGGSPFLSDAYLDDHLPRGRIRSRVLTEFLGGSELKRNELRPSLQTLHAELQSQIEYQTNRRSSEYRVRPAVASTLENDFSDYKLADPRLGHLYWVLFWRDQLSTDMSAFWVRKLITHIKAADAPIMIAKSLPPDVTNEYFNAIVDTASQALKACLLSDLPALIDRAYALIDDERPGQSESQVRRLRRLTWQVYAVLAKDDLLNIVLRLQDRQHPDGSKSTSPRLGVLDRTFLETMAIWEGQSHDELHRMTLSLHQSDPSVRAYGRARTAWLLLSLDAVVGDVPTTLRELAGDAWNGLPTLINAAAKRLQARNNQLVALDVMTLTNAVWCLLLGLERKERRLGWGELANLLDSILKVVDRIRRPMATAESLDSYDFMLDILLRELMILIYAAATRSSEVLLELQPGDERKAHLDRVAQAAAKASHVSLQPIERAGDWITLQLPRKIGTDLALIQVAWMALDLEELGSLVNVRRTQLTTHVFPKDRVEMVSEVAGGVAREIEAESWLGLLANALLAASARSSAEVKARFMAYGVALAIKAGLGANLLASLCYSTIWLGHAYDIDADSFLKHLLRLQSRGGRPRRYLRGQLNGTPDDEVPLATLCLTNVAARSKLPDASKLVIGELQNRAKQMADDGAAKSALEFIELSMLRASLEANRPPPVDEILDTWRHGHSAHAFASVLNLVLLHEPSLLHRLAPEVVALLEANPYPEYSSFLAVAKHCAIGLYLARQEGNLPAEQAPLLQKCIRYLRLTMRFWEGELGVDETLNIYRFLVAADPTATAHYRERIGHWAAVQLDEYGKRRLPTLVQQGKLFLVFLNYYESGKFFGLETEVDPASMHQLAQAGPEERRRAVEGLGGGTPAPFVQTRRGIVLSSRFLTLGQYLFQEPVIDDEEFDDARRRFNEKAADNIDILIRELKALPRLPDEIRTILENHRTALTEPSLPTARTATG